MKVKLINIATALVINFSIACIIEFIINGQNVRWWFIMIWTVMMALLQIFFMKKKKPVDKAGKGKI